MNEKWSRIFDGLAGRRVRALPHGGKTTGLAAHIARGGHLLAEAGVETIWPTRCVICDRPGELLCRTCTLSLPYIDRWLACPRCGAPHGRNQCVDCNGYSLSEVGRNAPPFVRCVSAIEHRGSARSIAIGYKDTGERRLAAIIAQMMANCIPRSWTVPGTAIAYVPADRRAKLRRGFDHMEHVAHALSGILGLHCINPLRKLPAADQRGLGRAERFANMANALQPVNAAGAPIARRVILVDDVYTTGATLFAASDALLAAGVQEVRCATFARVT